MRTNARMNRFEHCNEPKQRATISAHLHTFGRMYAPIIFASFRSDIIG
jgi:hypothetical protein